MCDQSQCRRDQLSDRRYLLFIKRYISDKLNFFKFVLLNDHTRYMGLVPFLRWLLFIPQWQISSECSNPKILFSFSATLELLDSPEKVQTGTGTTEGYINFWHFVLH